MNEKISDAVCVGEERNKQIPLNSTFAVEFSGKESPSELFCQEQGITCIGELGEVTCLRKVDLSFNPLTSLDKIQQLNQLRHLSAYCCRLTDIECLCGIKRLETLFLQQNGISSIPFGNSFHKLRELRLDRNQISCVDTLSICSNLRTLNLSWNNITSLEGLAGLQNLQEINVSHNSLDSLKHLRALPSLVELDVSHNSLKNLSGLQLLPTLEVLHAEGNCIATIAIPKTYFSHLNKELDKKGGGSNSAAKGEGGSAAAESTRSGSSSKQATRKPSMGAKSVSSAQFSRKGSLASESASKKAEDEHKGLTAASDTIVGLQSLSELYLNGNCIQTLQGLEAYGVNLDTLDLSDNEICDTEGAVLAYLSKLKKLNNLKILGNRIPVDTLGDSSSSASLPAVDGGDDTSAAKAASFMELLSLSCPDLNDIDGRPVKREKNKKVAKRKDSGGFHTWEDGSVSVAEPSDVMDEEKSAVVDDSADGSISDDEEYLRMAEEEAAEEYKKKNPALVIETMLTREEVIEKETIFRDLLSHTKERIVEAVRSFVPVELQETGFDIDGLDLKKLSAAASRGEKSAGIAANPKSKGTKAENGARSRQNSATFRAKKAALAISEDVTKANDENGGGGSRQLSNEEGRSRPGTEISRATKLRTAVGASPREAPTPTDHSSIPRIIGATHVEATKKKTVAGRLPMGLDTRVKRDVPSSPEFRAVQSARMNDESSDKASRDKDKPNSARLASDGKAKVNYTERSSSFSFGERREATSSTTVRVSQTVLDREPAADQGDLPPSLQLLESNDGDNQSIQWAPLSSTEMSASAPGEYISERYAAALKEGLATMESMSSGIEWREMILHEDIQDWDEQSISELQEMYSPRYEHVSDASKVPPPGKSREKGKALKSFRVPALQTDLASKSTTK